MQKRGIQVPPFGIWQLRRQQGRIGIEKLLQLEFAMNAIASALLRVGPGVAKRLLNSAWLLGVNHAHRVVIDGLLFVFGFRL